MPAREGIRLINLQDASLVRIVGGKEAGERFMKVVLFQGRPMRNPAGCSSMVASKK